MPGRNGTGPEGEGRLTGRGLGPCSTDAQQEGETLPVGRGLGPCGLGLRRGLGRLFGINQPKAEGEVQLPVGRGRRRRGR